MATGVLSLSGAVIGLLTGNKHISVPNIATTSAIGQISVVKLNSGDNVISVPTGATSAVIYPPANNTFGITLKGAGGDTGIPLRRNVWSVLSLDGSATSFILNAANIVVGVEISFL
jgi:hypothetical protein